MKDRDNSWNSLHVTDGTYLIFYFHGLGQKVGRCCWWWKVNRSNQWKRSPCWTGRNELHLALQIPKRNSAKHEPCTSGLKTRTSARGYPIMTSSSVILDRIGGGGGGNICFFCLFGLFFTSFAKLPDLQFHSQAIISAEETRYKTFLKNISRARSKVL